MTLDQIKEDIHRYIMNELNDSQEFGEDANLIQQGLIDSMGVMKLLGFLENCFSIEIELEAVTEENFKTVSRIAEFLMDRNQG